ncbi:TrmB family transcriptional regulator [Candidatus Woesearchaeota archaeon]|nr:TrmB family transcriptional regulator [Candidatus Woesearchaeota archaeon]
MIVNDEFLKKLRSAFDLNIYEVKIWTALLSKGIATAGELSDISDVPRSRCYDVLESLEKIGFVVMKLGKPIKYIAVKPDEVVKRVKKSLQDLALAQVKSLENVEKDEFFNELNLLYKNGITHIDPMLISGAIKGRRNIYDQIGLMLESAQKEVLILTSAAELNRKYENFGSLFKKLSNKGVKIKIAVPIKDNLKDNKITKELGQIAEVRKIDNSMQGRFVIIDGKQMVFMLNSDENVHESYDTAVWINSPFFSNALNNLFENTWSKLEKV